MVVAVKVVLLDRDGIINELMYFPEQGTVDSPFLVDQMKLTPFAVSSINRLHELGFRVFVISNQPGMAKGHFDEATFDSISRRMRELLKEGEAYVDGEYYCFHHPQGSREKYRMVCDCRKPLPGLILKAARENNFSIPDTFMIGDGIVDVKAGRAAGCRTILVASVNGFLLKLLADQNAEPDFLVRTLREAVKVVERTTSVYSNA
jgi:D-glycero-D-manno-heptose 1,7-bisphosphate phosphatase